MNKQKTITLFSVIESMQRSLEKQGVDTDLADATIMRRLRSSGAHRRLGAFRRLVPVNP